LVATVTLFVVSVEKEERYREPSFPVFQFVATLAQNMCSLTPVVRVTL
jgi:hypothetical protein